MIRGHQLAVLGKKPTRQHMCSQPLRILLSNKAHDRAAKQSVGRTISTEENDHTLQSCIIIRLRSAYTSLHLHLGMPYVVAHPLC